MLNADAVPSIFTVDMPGLVISKGEHNEPGGVLPTTHAADEAGDPEVDAPVNSLQVIFFPSFISY